MYLVSLYLANVLLIFTSTNFMSTMGIFEMSPANRRVNEYCISPLADRRPTGQTAKLQWAGQALSADFHLPVRLAAWTGMSHATMPRWRLFLLLVRRRAECPTLEFHNEWISIAI